MENDSNDCFQLQISDLSVIKEGTQILTCIVSSVDGHCQQSTNISEFLEKQCNQDENQEKRFLESNEWLNDLLLLNFHSDFYTPEEEFVSQILVSREISSEDVRASEMTFQVDLGDFEEPVEPFWLVDGEIVLNQKCFQKDFIEYRQELIPFL